MVALGHPFRTQPVRLHAVTDPITSASSPTSPIAEPTDNLVAEPVKPRWAGFEPLDNPHLRIKIKPPRTNPLPPGHWFVAAVFVAVSAAYIAGCAYYADIKHQGVGLLQRAEAGGSVKPAEVIAWLDRAHRAYYSSLLCFVLIFFGCFVWMRFLHRRVGSDFMARSPARTAWLVGVIVSFVLNVVGHGRDSRSDAIGTERLSMWFYIVRAVVGALYLWMFVTLARRSAAALRAKAAERAQPPGQNTIEL
jgi:hypothetical protein